MGEFFAIVCDGPSNKSGTDLYGKDNRRGFLRVTSLGSFDFSFDIDPDKFQACSGIFSGDCIAASKRHVLVRSARMVFGRSRNGSSVSASCLRLAAPAVEQEFSQCYCDTISLYSPPRTNDYSRPKGPLGICLSNKAAFLLGKTLLHIARNSYLALCSLVHRASSRTPHMRSQSFFRPRKWPVISDSDAGDGAILDGRANDGTAFRSPLPAPDGALIGAPHAAPCAALWAYRLGPIWDWLVTHRFFSRASSMIRRTSSVIVTPSRYASLRSHSIWGSVKSTVRLMSVLPPKEFLGRTHNAPDYVNVKGAFA